MQLSTTPTMHDAQEISSLSEYQKTLIKQVQQGIEDDNVKVISEAYRTLLEEVLFAHGTDVSVKEKKQAEKAQDLMEELLVQANLTQVIEEVQKSVFLLIKYKNTQSPSSLVPRLASPISPSEYQAALIAQAQEGIKNGNIKGIFEAYHAILKEVANTHRNPVKEVEREQAKKAKIIIDKLLAQVNLHHIIDDVEKKVQVRFSPSFHNLQVATYT